MSKRNAPEVNAGSMADIAFLLLIFFLITTTIHKDKGILRQLPSKQIETVIVDVHKRNVLEININKRGEIQIEERITPISEVANLATAFIDNGGATKDSEAYCDYCRGKRDITSSDNPSKAIISVNASREAPYESYIVVQNELNKAYNTLRNRESQRLFKYNYTEMKRKLDEGQLKSNTEKVKSELKQIRTLFPMLISEAETQKLF